MTASRRGLTIGLGALVLALSIFAVTVVQFGVLIDHALAQSSVRPPESAVNVEDDVVPAPNLAGDGMMPWQEGQDIRSTAGGSVRPPENAADLAPSQPGMPRAQDAANPAEANITSPLGTEGVNSDSTLWGEIRRGAQGTVSIPDEKLGVLVQPRGAGWGSWREKGGPLQEMALYAIGGMLALLLLFFLLRGRIRIEHGKSGVLIERFKGIERFSHWLLAASFILLALSGLNLLFGKDYIMPLIGKEAFATITQTGKWVHTNMSWAFMLALVLIFVMWVWHNIPTLLDVKWFLKAGGLFSKHSHPSSRKFNGGQKLIFWSTIILGASISLSGLALLFPYELPMFAKTFAILNSLGVEAIWGSELRTDLTAMEEQQYAQIWHTMVAIVMIAIILAHIYIGSIGMEGAFDAMGSGQVDRNWAKEHHDLWVEKKDRETGGDARAGQSAAQPAE